MDLSGTYPVLERADSVYAFKEYSERMAELLKPRWAQFNGAQANSPAGMGAAMGLLTDSNVSLNNDFATGNNGNNITITKTGLYVGHVEISPSASPGNLHLWAIYDGQNILSEQQITYGSNVHTATFEFRAVAAGKTIGFGITSSNTVNFTAVVKLNRQPA